MVKRMSEKSIKVTRLVLVIIFSVVILTGTGVGIWVGVRNNSLTHPNPTWSFKVSGNIVGGEINITMQTMLSLPSYEQVYTIKAKTNYDALFKGVQLSYLFTEVIDVNPSAKNVTFSAWDGYSWTFNLSEVLNNDTYILAYMKDGQYLTSYPEGGNGYLWLIVPAKNPADFNGQRCVKSVTEIIFA